MADFHGSKYRGFLRCMYPRGSELIPGLGILFCPIYDIGLNDG